MISAQSISSIFIPKPHLFLCNPISCASFTFIPLPSSKEPFHFRTPQHKIPQNKTGIWRISAASENVLPSNPSPIVDSQQASAANGDFVPTLISILLYVAFLALSFITLGAIYLGVTDVLQKRQADKLVKEDEIKKKKKVKKRAKVRSGPRGFGQKIDKEDDD